MEFEPNSPIWLQVVTAIKADLASGRLAPGDKLPSGRDLALKYKINPNTAARVYQELEREALCETRRGLGTFATESAERIRRLRRELAETSLRKFLETADRLGISRAEAARMITEAPEGAQEEKTNA